MRRLDMRGVARYLSICALIVLSGAMLFVVYPQKAQAATPAIKIMPLGDSITGSPGCWRALLWNHLQSTGYTNINFVGTLNNSQACGVTFDGDNEGHGGFLATNIVSQHLLPGWLSATNPDIVMMHLGTNDVWNNIAPDTILAAYSTLVDQMRANNPRMKILVAQILPMNPSGCSACAQRVINLDAVIPGWASAKSTAQSPITVVNQWAGFNDSADTVDGVHPNSTTGIQKVANRWYPALTALLTTGNGGGGSFNPNAHYKLVNHYSGKVIDVSNKSTADGANIIQWSDSGTTNQQWSIVAVGSYYKLVNVNSGKVLDDAGASTANGTQMVQWADSGTTNQQWSIIAVGSYYKLVNHTSGKVLDDSGNSTANGTAVIQWSDSGTSNQQWNIVQV